MSGLKIIWNKTKNTFNFAIFVRQSVYWGKKKGTLRCHKSFLVEISVSSILKLIAKAHFRTSPALLHPDPWSLILFQIHFSREPKIQIQFSRDKFRQVPIRLWFSIRLVDSLCSGKVEKLAFLSWPITLEFSSKHPKEHVGKYLLIEY